MTTEFRNPRGLNKRIFGSILFFLGALNIMFATKAGFKVELFFIFITAAGVLLFAYGLIEGFKEKSAEAAGGEQEAARGKEGIKISGGKGDSG